MKVALRKSGGNKSAALRITSIPCSDQKKLNIPSLIDFNYSLEKEFLTTRLNENFIKQKLRELEKIGPIGEKTYWLTCARINELALFCASNYVDNLEFGAAGDLLLNPRRIIVHGKNLMYPIQKERHATLSEQFSGLSGTTQARNQWLKKETFLEIKEKPLLPEMYEKLKDSGWLTEEYLDSVRARMERLADVINFLCAWKVSGSRELYFRLRSASQEEKDFITAHFCRFQKGIFFELGQDFYQLSRNKNYQSKFLRS